MPQRYRNLPVAWQVLIVTVALCATMFSAFTAFVAWSTERASMRQTEADLRIQLDSVAGMLDYAHDNAKARAVRQMEIFRTLLKGKIQTDGTTMLTGEAKDIPVLKLGDEVLNNNKKYLDQIREYSGAIAGILVRRGDTFFRVTSAVKDQKGRNTTGLPLPAWDTSTASLLKGEPHLSVALRPNNYYMVYLTPLFDDSHRVIGALDVRLDLTADIESLKQRMKAIKVGETGFLFSFLPVAGEDLALFVVHPELQAQMAGKALDEAAKARVTRTIAAKGGMEIFDAPDKADAGRVKPRIEMYRHTPSWNWIVGTGSFVDEFVQESRSLRNMLTLISVLCGLATALLLYFAIRSRLAPLGEVLRQVTLIGEGDLTVRMRDGHPLSRNEMDLLATRLNATTDHMAELIGGITKSAGSVGDAAGELQRSADQIAGASQEQSQSASSVAASVEQLSVSIAHAAENAREAHQVTDDASQVSNRGKDVVGRAVNEMEQVAAEIGDMASLVKSLGERSQHISGIVGVIKEIADQTNLLALNAAIEAARAGEQGRGFAVVADEVRSLAERTSRSTEEIAGMIGAVQSETTAVVKRMESVTGSMQGGLELVREAGSTLGEIHGRTGRTVNAIEEIANATREQKAASEQIARTVERIAGMSEESSALTEENRNSAKGLLTLAARLDAMVKRFRVG